MRCKYDVDVYSSHFNRSYHILFQRGTECVMIPAECEARSQHHRDMIWWCDVEMLRNVLHMNMNWKQFKMYITIGRWWVTLFHYAHNKMIRARLVVGSCCCLWLLLLLRSYCCSANAIAWLSARDTARRVQWDVYVWCFNRLIAHCNRIWHHLAYRWVNLLLLYWSSILSPLNKKRMLRNVFELGKMIVWHALPLRVCFATNKW